MVLARIAGRRWEEFALRHMQSAGLELLERNFQCRTGELDLILKDQGTLVFAEVRFRGRRDYGSGAESVTTGKQRRLIAAAQYYLHKHPDLGEQPCRFDVVSLGPGEPPQVQWIRNAFTLDDV